MNNNNNKIPLPHCKVEEYKNYIETFEIISKEYSKLKNDIRNGILYLAQDEIKKLWVKTRNDVINKTYGKNMSTERKSYITSIIGKIGAYKKAFNKLSEDRKIIAKQFLQKWLDGLLNSNKNLFDEGELGKAIFTNPNNNPLANFMELMKKDQRYDKCRTKENKQKGLFDGLTNKKI